VLQVGDEHPRQCPPSPNMSTLRRFSSSDPGLPNRPSRRHLAMMILRRVMGERALKGLISVLRHHKHQLVERACLLDFAAGDISAGLCPNEETVDESRSFLMHGGAGGDKSFKSHPIITAHLNYIHRDPVLLDPSNFR